MIGSRNLSWPAAGCIALVCSLMSATHVVAAGADEAAIRAQSVNWEKAFNGGDAKALTALYADDALVLPPNAPGARGREAILALFNKDIADAKAAGAVFKLSPKTDVGISGNLGWESGTYTVTVKGAVVESGKFLSVSRKQKGKWLYVRDTWNADAPPAPAAAPAAAAPAAAAPAAAAPAAAPAPKK